MQGQHPIAYYSRVLSAQARYKSIYERELMAIVFAVQKWQPYLTGHKFIVHTDQKGLKFLLEQRLVGAEHQRWITKLIGYDFEVQYRPEIENKATDALSRMSIEVSLANISIPQMITMEELHQQVRDDKSLRNIILDLERKHDSHSGYKLMQDKLLCEGRSVLPKGSPIIATLLKDYHNGPIGGHSGMLKTYKRMQANLYWEGIKKDIENYVAMRAIFQEHKCSTLSPARLLQPLQVPSLVWDDPIMDFIEGLPKSEGFNTILVVVGRLSKYTRFIALEHPFSAQSVALIFTKEVVRLHGVPHSIVSNHDKVFMSFFSRMNSSACREQC